jgi:membrane fusion protein, multidrug efflux system
VRKHRWWVAGAVAVALGISWWAGWWPWSSAASGGQPRVAPVVVEVMPAAFGNLTQTAVVVGQVSAQMGTVLKAEVTGKVTALPFTEGAAVAQGAVLVQLDDAVERAELAQAEANRSLASNTLARTTRLQQADAASLQELDQAAAQEKLARANVALAQANLAKRTIVAPFAGVAGLRSVTVGELVQPGQPLLTVSDNTNLKVIFKVPEAYTPMLTVGQTIQLVDDTGAVITSATISAQDAALDATTRTRAVQALVSHSTLAGSLVPGQFVSVQVPVATQRSATLVPEQALVPRGMDNLLYVISTSGSTAVASATQVQVALRGGGQVALQSSLPSGTQVVVAGQQRLQQPVVPVQLVTPTLVPLRPAEVERIPPEAR